MKKKIRKRLNYELVGWIRFALIVQTLVGVGLDEV